MVAVRFDDGYGSVSIPEFLEFFLMPPTARTAKAAASAVRMSLDLLSLDADSLLLAPNDPLKDRIFDETFSQSIVETHNTSNLDKSARKLVILWAYIRDDLENTFDAFKKPEDEPIIEIEKFKVKLITNDVNCY